MIQNGIFLIVCLIISKIGYTQEISESQKKHTDSLKLNLIEPKSPIISLTYQEYQAYKQGNESNRGKAAEYNSYPSPSLALNCEKELKLTANQKTSLNKIKEALLFKAVEMGNFILQQEKNLNDLFASGKANEGSVIYYTNKLGLYEGELRNAFLQAHLKTRQVLTKPQILEYNKLHGYSK